MPSSMSHTMNRKIIRIYCGAERDVDWSMNFLLTWCGACGLYTNRRNRESSMQELRARLLKLTAVFEALKIERDELQRSYDQRKDQLYASTSTFRIQLLGFPKDRLLMEIAKRINSHTRHNEFDWYKRAIEELGIRIASEPGWQRQRIKAQILKNAREAETLAKNEEQQRQRADSFRNLETDYDRHQFCIVTTDYRRGNGIDNYFRKGLLNKVLAAFNHACVLCGSPENLTLDHYGLSKNEGGNFALRTADKASIRPNGIVLCRFCNSAKGQIRPESFFSAEQREHILSCHRSLLEVLLQDKLLLKLLSK